MCGDAEFIRSLVDLQVGPVMLMGPTMDAKVASELSLRLAHLGIRMAEHSRRAAAYAERLAQVPLYPTFSPTFQAFTRGFLIQVKLAPSSEVCAARYAMLRTAPHVHKPSASASQASPSVDNVCEAKAPHSVQLPAQGCRAI